MMTLLSVGFKGLLKQCSLLHAVVYYRNILAKQGKWGLLSRRKRRTKDAPLQAPASRLSMAAPKHCSSMTARDQVTRVLHMCRGRKPGWAVMLEAHQLALLSADVTRVSTSSGKRKILRLTSSTSPNGCILVIMTLVVHSNCNRPFARTKD
jgi:hypothetical protein